MQKLEKTMQKNWNWEEITKAAGFHLLVQFVEMEQKKLAKAAVITGRVSVGKASLVWQEAACLPLQQVTCCTTQTRLPPPSPRPILPPPSRARPFRNGPKVRATLPIQRPVRRTTRSVSFGWYAC